MCDCVVHTDGEGHIQANDSRLAAELLHDVNAAHTMIGNPLQHYMRGDDVQRCNVHFKQMQAHHDATELVHPLHVDLYDYLNNKMPVELLCSCVNDSCGVPN